MRQIKFRAWHPVQGMTMTPVLTTSSYTGDVSCIGYNKELDRFKLELMQFTGLKDKNGVEIYEGDIVAHNDVDQFGVKLDTSKNFVVLYNGHSARFENAWNFYGVTVIGNIHENPELLNE